MFKIIFFNSVTGKQTGEITEIAEIGIAHNIISAVLDAKSYNWDRATMFHFVDLSNGNVLAKIVKV